MAGNPAFRNSPAFTENAQRDDLNPVEEAEGYRTLVSSFNLTQSEVAEWMGLSLMRFRRHVLRSLQQKTEFCGFVPYNGSVVERG